MNNFRMIAYLSMVKPFTTAPMIETTGYKETSPMEKGATHYLRVERISYHPYAFFSNEPLGIDFHAPLSGKDFYHSQ